MRSSLIALALLPLLLSQACLGHVFVPVVVPGAATGSFNQQAMSNVNQGFNTDTTGRLAQTNDFSNAQAYDRANTAQSQASGANIGVAGVVGAGSSGFNTKALSSKFDQGALTANQAQGVNQAQHSAASGLNSQVTNAGLATTTSLNGPAGASFGRTGKSLFADGVQSQDNVNGLHQNLAQTANTNQEFSRGALNRDEANAATIGQGIGGAGSSGQSQANFAATLDQGKVKSHANRNANNVAKNRHQASLAATTSKSAVDTASIFGGGLGSSGSTDQHARGSSRANAFDAAQNAQDVATSVGDAKMLNSEYAKGSRGSAATIGTGLGGGLSSGSNYAANAAGYDKQAQVNRADDAASKSASTTTTSFNNEANENALHSNAIIL